MPLVEIATFIAEKAASTALDPVLRDLLGVQDRQLAALNDIDHRVRALIQAPWEEARLHIEEATHTSDGPRRERYLDEARAALMRAFSVQHSYPDSRAAIAADLAMVLGLLGLKADAIRWALNARGEQHHAVDDAATRVTKELNRPSEVSLRVEHRLKAVLKSDLDWRDFHVSQIFGPTYAYASLFTRFTWPRGVKQRGMREGDFRNTQTFGEVWDSPRLDPTSLELAVRALRDATRQAVEYREACLALDNRAMVPEYEVHLDLSTPYRGRVQWRPRDESLETGRAASDRLA